MPEMSNTNPPSNDSPDANSINDQDASSDRSSSIVQVPTEIILRHRQIGRTWAWQSLAILGWMSVLVLFGMLQYHWFVTADYYDDKTGVNEFFHSGDPNAKDRIAILKITGVIYDGSGYVKSQIDRIKDDKRIKAVVLRVNSPGGTVSGADYIYHHLKKMLAERDIPVVVSMGSVAASGGYYVSMVVGDQDDAIFAEPTCTTGSIGVIIPHWNYSDLMETYGVVDDSIMSHPRKRMLTPSKKMPDDHRKLLQEYVDESFEKFKSVILEGRPKFRLDNDVQNNPDAKINLVTEGRDVATGEIFHAPKALKLGLIDRLGFIEEAIDRAAELADVSLESVRVVEYSRPAPWIELPYLSQAETSNQIWNTLMEMNTPRAYFISTSLPPMIATWQDPFTSTAE